MQFKILFIQAIVLCIAYEASATFNLNGCGCNDEGVDICSGAKCSQGGGVTAPRPYPIQSPRPAQPLIKTICKEHSSGSPKSFNPIGDICNCGRQIVKPAPLPNIRALCSHQLPKIEITRPSSCSCSSCLNLRNNVASSSSSSSTGCSCGQEVKAPAQAHHDASIYLDTPKRKAVAQPKPQRYGSADVVSVAIAQRLANSAQNRASERQLQYGSMKEPTVVEKKSTNNIRKGINVNEESFYNTNGDVLEIKANMFHRKPQLSSESESEESEEVKTKKVAEPFNPARLRYEDIGYGAYEQKHKPQYVVVKNSTPQMKDCGCGAKTPSPPRHRLHNHFQRKSQPCNCHSDLVVDQSAVSEQVVSFENNSSSGQDTRFST